MRGFLCGYPELQMDESKNPVPRSDSGLRARARITSRFRRSRAPGTSLRLLGVVPATPSSPRLVLDGAVLAENGKLFLREP